MVGDTEFDIAMARRRRHRRHRRCLGLSPGRGLVAAMNVPVAPDFPTLTR
jgi:phosphoglycolate phosphatase-like HAD superfamily hydrolase